MKGNKVFTKVVYEWQDDKLVLVHAEGYEWAGSFALCKGDSTLKASEQASLANQQAQMAFNQQLMSIFQQQYSDQKAVLDFLTNKLKPMIENPTGYSPEALAAMRTSATDTLSQNYQNAQKALQQQQFLNGGRDLPSGVNEQLNAALMQAEAADKSNAQNTITLNNENLKQSNLWNAMNVLSGNVAQQFNPLGYAGSATNAANSASDAGNATANLGNAYFNSKKGFWSSFTQSLGSTLGSTLGGGNAQGGSGVGGYFGLCWIAAAVFDEDLVTGHRVNLVRNYLLADFSHTAWGRAVVRLYAKHGAWIAKQPALVWMLAPLFKLALKKAEGR